MSTHDYDLDEDDFDEIPDAFTSEGECWAWKNKPGVIGASQHTHVCRQPAAHDEPHLCTRCGETF